MNVAEQIPPPTAPPIAPTEQPRLFDALAHEAPYLIEKLVEDRIAEDEAEAHALFREVKRFLVLSRASDDTTWELGSRRVDEAWRQFVLFTREYIQFCMRYFGGYVQHAPGRPAPPREAEEPPLRSEPSFEAFRTRYQQLFGVPLPDIWYDHQSVTPRRRVINDHAGRMTVRMAAGMVALLGPSGTTLLSVNSLAAPALRFIAENDAFYVRELPGELSDEEQSLLVASLVEQQVLRVAP